MEVDGIIEIFKRSVKRFGVNYKRYIADGDLKTFTNLLEADPYNGNPIVEKKVCVLHVKKCMYRCVKEDKNTYAVFESKKQLEEAEKEEKLKKEKLKTKKLNL